MTSTLLRNTTALAMVLAMSMPVQPGISFAQDNAVDCSADPQNAACGGGAAQPADEAPAEPEAQPAPAEQAPAEQAPVEQAPVEPAAEEPAPQPAAEEPAAQPAQEVPAPPAEAPAEEIAPAQEAPAEAAPAAEEPAAEEAAPASEPAASEEPAAVEDPAPVPEAAPTEEAAPAEKPEAPVEETAPEEKPATPTTEAQPSEKPAAPTEETTPDAKPEASEAAPAATEETAEPAVKPEATDEQPAEATGEAPAASEADAETTAGEQPAEQTEQQAQPAEDVTKEPGELIEQKAASEPIEPAAVVSDDITNAQRTEIKQQEERRRDDARDRRLELLGAAAVGAGIGMLIPALGGKVVEDQGDRLIVERDGDYYVRKDENSLLRYGDAEFRAERLRGGRTREIVTRQNGTRIVTIRDEGGYILYRSRVLPDGREYVLVDNRNFREDRRRRNYYERELPPLRVDIPRDRYIVPAGQANYDDIYQTFTAPPVEQVEQAYSLREVRESERLRDKVRRVDLDTITFDTGSAVVRQSQVPQLEDIARASIAMIDEDPSTVLLIEGHTDAVGSEVSNLALSDRRAETVARILSEVYGVPPENMVVQGYGEDYLKIDTQGAEERNRRVTLRNITPLLSARNQ
ncbi:OmpA family protein [Rhodobacterales bacterium]|nr:OmpA family protein [Rhodobacterales bacterium]